MEFNEKLQELRKRKGLTQEELAEKLYVSRTAVSKWESGRGYPSIDSLKAIAKFFSVTVDELLSSNEMLTMVEENHKQTKKQFCDLIFGLIDVCTLLLLFLPLFAVNIGNTVYESSLLMLDGVEQYIKVMCLIVVIVRGIMGVLILALQNCTLKLWSKLKYKLSLVLDIFGVILFIAIRQPYVTVFVFALLIIKTIVLFKRA